MATCSIIIPVYNKHDYVGRCLQMALSQEFADYEVVAVDDGSTDGSGAVCDAVAAEDPRLRVIHTANGGVTAARREGVKAAQGDFVMFCDSDDELLPHAIADAYRTAVETGADEVIAPFRNQHGRIFDSGRRGEIDADDIICDFLSSRMSFPPNAGVLYRRSMLDGCLETPRDIVMGEDLLFHMTFLMKKPRVVCNGTVNYVYNQGISAPFTATLEYEQAYDAHLRHILKARWDDFEPWYTWHQLKSYERLIDQRQFDVRSKYYRGLRVWRKPIPLTDRIAYLLPPRIAYIVISYYKRRLARQVSGC